MTEDITSHPYELLVCSDFMSSTHVWDNFCKHLHTVNNAGGIEQLRCILDDELARFGAINPPGDYLRFKTEEQRTWFVLNFA